MVYKVVACVKKAFEASDMAYSRLLCAILGDSKEAMMLVKQTISEFSPSDRVSLFGPVNQGGVSALHLIALTGNLALAHQILGSLSAEVETDVRPQTAALLAGTDSGITPIHVALYRHDRPLLQLFESFIGADNLAIGFSQKDDAGRGAAEFVLLPSDSLSLVGSRLVVQDSVPGFLMDVSQTEDTRSLLDYINSHRVN